MVIRFFDINSMVGRWTAPKLKFHTAGELLAEMDYHRIDKTVVFHSHSWLYDPEDGNRRLIKEISDSDRLYPCWVLLPFSTGEIGKKVEDTRGEELIKKINQHKVCTIRLFPKTHNYRLLDWNIGDLLSILNQIRIPVLINLDEVDLNEVYQIGKNYPDIPLIVSRTSYRSTRMFYSIMEKIENFYIDICDFLVFRGLEDGVKRFGAKRFLFGSNMPFSDPGGPIAAVNYSNISDTDKELVAHGNLENLIGNIRPSVLGEKC